jgi:hypothetical protein
VHSLLFSRTLFTCNPRKWIQVAHVYILASSGHRGERDNKHDIPDQRTNSWTDHAENKVHPVVCRWTAVTLQQVRFAKISGEVFFGVP